jgi:hypothetical protein
MKALFSNKKIIIPIFIYLLISSIFILATNVYLVTDAKSYNKNAELCIEQRTLYPSVQNKYDSYIQNPGYVNFLVLLKKLGLSIKGIFFINLLLNIGLLLTLFILAQRIFGQPIYAFLIFFIIYPRNYVINMDLYSELLCIVLAYLSILLYLKENKYLSLLSGFLMAFANYIRPVALIFVASILLFSLIRKIPKVKIIYFTGALLVAVFLIGIINYQSSGFFIFQSVTSGNNLLIGANPDADGRDYKKPFLEGKIGYIPDTSNMTFFEKDKYWRDKAIRWIIQNPAKYMSLFFKKIYYSYERDSWGINRLANTNLESDQIKKLPSVQRFFWYFFQWANQFIYILIVIVGLISVKNFDLKNDSLLFYLIILFGTIFIGLIMGDTRLKYPLMPSFLILSSYTVSKVRFNRVFRSIREKIVSLAFWKS